MNQLLFWNTWQKPYKQLYQGLLWLFFVTLIFFLVGWNIGVDMTFPWETYVQGETVKVTIDSIKSGPFQLPLEIENYLLTESFQGGDLTLYKWPAYLFSFIIGIIFTVAITCITTLKRFWYLVGMGLVIAFLMSFQLENLQLFGMYDKTALIGVFVLYLPLSYYYQSIKKDISFSFRLLSFALVTVVISLVIFFGAEVRYPFVYLATYGYIAPIILSILFILMISHQILTGFMYLITNSNNAYSKNSLTHFLIITSVYLINLFIIVLNEIQYLHWEFLNIHPFVLLLISSLIGIAFYSLREETYKHIYHFYPIGGFVYLILGSICFFTIGYYLFSANEAIIEVFEDFILYAHLGYGLMFLVYILANFLNPLGRNLQVYKVLYKPQNMPYFTYRFAGTIVALAFVLISDYNIPVFHTMSTYYSGLGDLHTQIGEKKIAEVYYGKGKSFDYRNHRANYALGTIARKEGDNAKAAYHFNEAMQKRPTPQAFVNMSNIYLEEGKFFDGLFTIRDASKEFPDDDRIKINLGLLYEKAKEPDTAYLTFDAARSQAITEKSANVNLLSLIGKGDYVYDLDSVISEYVVEDHNAMINNGFALYSANQRFWDRSILTDTLLNLVTGYGLYNQSINYIYSNDSTYLHELHTSALISGNIAFRENLLFATTLGYYYHNEVAKAYQLMAQLVTNYPAKSGYYLYVLGLWSLDQRAPLLAVDFFKRSRDRGYSKANLTLAIATMEAGLIDEAKDYWNEVSINVDPMNRQMAENALQMLNKDDLTDMNDAEMYWYWRYQVSKENEILTQEIIDTMSDTNYKLQVHIDLVEYFLAKGDTTQVVLLTQERLNSTDESIQNQLYWLYKSKNDLLGKLDIADSVSLSKIIDSKPAELILRYYEARYAAIKNDTLSANHLFDKVAANPFFTQGVIGKAHYLSNNGKNIEAYNVLLSALEINPYAVNLRKQYIMQCASMGFDTYGEHALEELTLLISGSEYRNFKQQYEDKLKATQEAFEYFED